MDSSPHPRLQQNAFNPVTLVASSVFKPTVDITYSLSSIEMVSVDPKNVRLKDAVEAIQNLFLYVDPLPVGVISIPLVFFRSPLVFS